MRPVEPARSQNAGNEFVRGRPSAGITVLVDDGQVWRAEQYHACWSPDANVLLVEFLAPREISPPPAEEKVPLAWAYLALAAWVVVAGLGLLGLFLTPPP